ncbi:MAG: sulfurtransferase [Candidatus Aminicenantes bacterium]|nr:sulfurtransferase [Candidatus Aminicenantes bacterium]
MRKKLLLLAISLALAGLNTLALGAPPPAEKLVGTDWLQANLSRTDVRVVDMRGDIREYWEGHIPGAVFLDSATLRWSNRGVPGKLMPMAALALMLGEMGIGKTTQVVVYSEINHYRATYFMWALDVLRHKNWVMLEGGFERWKKESHPVTQDYPAVKPVVYSTGREPDAAVLATLAQVRDRDAATTVLLDVRPPDLYAGEKGSWKRKGHIKGALNHFWALDVNEAGAWRPADELRRAYEALGVTPDKTVFVSCGQGLMSSHTYFTLKYILGYPRVKNYDGSFTEWSAVDTLPVETGK